MVYSFMPCGVTCICTMSSCLVLPGACIASFMWWLKYLWCWPCFLWAICQIGVQEMFGCLRLRRGKVKWTHGGNKWCHNTSKIDGVSLKKSLWFFTFDSFQFWYIFHLVVCICLKCEFSIAFGQTMSP